MMNKLLISISIISVAFFQNPIISLSLGLFLGFIMKDNLKGFISNVRFYANGLNVLTFTEYDMVDPEVAGRGYPLSKVWNLGLRVNAGHGLTYQNVEAIASIRGIEELNIGHTIISRAIAVGLREAVKEMKALVQFPRKEPLFGIIEK